MKKMHIGKPMNLTVALLVSGFAVKETPFSHSFPEGNLHLYDRTLYARQIRENALLRSGAAEFPW